MGENVAPGGVQWRGHQPGLDGVRGIAILSVMALHFVGGDTATNSVERVVIKTTQFGELGVDLFFVLSGFLITGLLLDAKGSAHYFKNFYARRTLRIFPLYYAVLIALFVVLPLFVGLPPSLQFARHRQAWLWTYTTNIEVARIGTFTALGYVTHLWSLAVEEHFYLVWPFVVYAVRRATLQRICTAVIVVVLGLRIAFALGGASEWVLSVLTPFRVDNLCLGGLLAILLRRDGGADFLMRNAARGVAACAAAAVVVSAWCAKTGDFLPVLHQVRVTIYAFMFGAVTLLGLRSPYRSRHIGRLLEARTLRTFGKYAYGLYVYHGLLTYLLLEKNAESRLTDEFGNHTIAMVVIAVGASAVSLAAAMLSYELFEKRFLSLKRYFEPRETRDRAVAVERTASTEMNH